MARITVETLNDSWTYAADSDAWQDKAAELKAADEQFEVRRFGTEGDGIMGTLLDALNRETAKGWNSDGDVANNGGGGGHAPRPVTEEEREAVEYAKAYTGTFQFMVDMREAAVSGRRFSPKMVAAVLKCKAADERRAASTEGQLSNDEIRALIDVASRSSNRFLHDMLLVLEGNRKHSDKQLIAIRKWIRPRAATQPATPDAGVTEGMYRNPETGEIFKVQVAHHGSGNLYAKRLVLGEAGEKATFEYEQGAIRKLRPEWKMTLEQAKEFGALYGVCCNCGATLTDERSIEAGIGPVCAGRFA